MGFDQLTNEQQWAVLIVVILLVILLMSICIRHFGHKDKRHEEDDQA